MNSSKLIKTISLIFLYLAHYINVVNSDCNDAIDEKVDFVVVGAGAAGCILAARLSEDKKFTVTLLEAGGEPPLISRIPNLAGLMIQTLVDWNYTSIPQKDALFNFPNRVMNLTRGKMLGGSASLNNLNFFRGNRLDYVNWRKNGTKNWGWNCVLNYFKKIENDTETGVERRHHGHNGPICITNPGHGKPLVDSFLSVVKRLGYSERDANGDGKQTGYSTAPINVCNNERQSTYTNYLKPVMSRKNLKVVTFALAERILLDNSKRAIGVSYSKDGCRRTVKAKREVIIAGGAINSPQILMLSGIGPRDHLQSMNIPVVSDLPVGDNFQDHLKTDIYFTRDYEDIYNNETLKQFFEGRGPLTDYSYGSAFINTRYSNNFYYPDIQLSLRDFAVPVQPGERLRYILRAVLSRPKSRGTLRLKSSNPKDHPIIDPRYLSDEYDVKVLAEGTKIADFIVKSMNVSGYRLEQISAPDCDRYDKKSGEYWSCVVRNNANTLYHYAGTCRMGPRNSSTSVVDNRLRVIGVKNLRVVDASVMPTETTGNIQAAVMMIAEKASAYIKSYHSRQ